MYGNRAYEDTLVEMEDAAKASGFVPVAAIAAVAEHSILPQYAAHRPDAEDERQLAGFAAKIAGKQSAVSVLPGNRPYKKAGGGGLVPKVTKACVQCGQCAGHCPVQAIDPVTFAADGKKCIGCMRCVKECPHNAQQVNGVMVNLAAMAIKKACSVRKDNELFL
ncbi:MAG: 4Fe-4S binding protein [Gemmiger sp.]